MGVCCECCVLSGRGLCDALITSPEESYRLWCVVVCDIETSRMRRSWPTGGLSRHKKKYSYWSLIVLLLQNTGCLSTLTYSIDQRSCPVLSESRNSQQCMQPEGSLPRLHEPDTCYMLRPTHSSLFHHPNNIGWRLQIIKLLILWFSPFSWNGVPLRFKHSPQHLILKHLQPTRMVRHSVVSL